MVEALRGLIQSKNQAEAIAARHSGMQVMGVSCITNMAAGVLPEPLSHEEVVAAAARARGDFTRLLELMIDIG